MTPRDRKSYDKWNELVQEIKDSTGIDEDEKRESIDKRKQRLEADPEEWFRYYFPRFAYAPPAGFHKEATNRVLRNQEWYEVRMWSRELAKSTRTMMEVLYLTLVGHPGNKASPSSPEGEEGARHRKRYVLLISNSLDNAIRLLMPYRANLQYNKRIIQDYGLQESMDHWAAAEFITIRGVAFRALGAGQSPRGARNDEVRPDILIFDDVDTDADCLNGEIIAKKWRWIEEAAIGTRSVSEPTTIIFCGNRIALDCCVERAVKHADHADQKNIRDETGLSVWPEKNTEADIERVLSQKSYAAQQKEYFNNPVMEGTVFKQMVFKPAKPIADYRQLVCYTDPSYKDTNDYKATVLVGKWEGEFHVIKCFLEQATTARMISWLYDIMDIVGERTCYYYMEDGFMQDVIRKEVSNLASKLGRSIPLSGDKRRKPDKYMRIETLLEPLHRNGELYLNEDERENPHMQRLAEQFLAFAPGSSVHDDGPDAVEGAVWIINDKMARGIKEGMIMIPRAVSENRL